MGSVSATCQGDRASQGNGSATQKPRVEGNRCPWPYQPGKTKTTAEPANDVSDTEAEMTLAEIGVRIEAMRHRLHDPATEAKYGFFGQSPNQLPWGSPMMATLASEMAANNRTPT